MKILLDGKYVGDGTIEAEYEVAKQHYGADFDISRLTYDPEDLRKSAANRLEAFKAATRSEVVPIPDPLHRDALFLKGESYLIAAAVEDPEYFKANYLPIIQQAAAAEAALRGLGEDPAELRKSSINKLLPLLGITCLIEGFGKKLELGLKDLPPDEIPAFLEAAEQQAVAMKAETLGGPDVPV